MTIGRPFVLLALVALAAAILWPSLSPVERATGSLIAQPASRTPVSVFVMEIPRPTEAPQTTLSAVKPAVRSAEPPALPFAFLGKLTEGGEELILLQSRGRALKVSGPGPLDENYEVEAILADALVIRFVPLGAQQFLELASHQPLAPYSSAADTPQD